MYLEINYMFYQIIIYLLNSLLNTCKMFFIIQDNLLQKQLLTLLQIIVFYWF